MPTARTLAVTLLLATLGAPACPAAEPAAGGELLYNGIELPADWPAQLAAPPAEPVTPAYLLAPPKVLPIDVGRQLFVDDFLIESTTLTRALHQAEYYAGNPVMAGGAYSGGLWFDPADGRIKYWHSGTRLSTSADGIHWQAPALDVRAGTNLVMDEAQHSTVIWLDSQAADPARRYVMIYTIGSEPKGHCRYWVRFSADGIHWSDKQATGADAGDRSTAFFNPFRKVWVFSIRHGWVGPRARRYWEVRDLATGPYWNTDPEQGPVVRAPYWIGADSADLPRGDVVDTEWVDRGLGIRPRAGVPCQLYNLDCLAYESLMLGFFTIWRGQPQSMSKPNDVCLGFSRDGWSWSRPDRRTIYPMHGNYTEAGHFHNIQSVGGGCLIMGDRLYLYTGRPGTRLATIRRDGFASMDAGPQGGNLVTRPLSFTGRRLFVNVDNPRGELRVAVLNAAGAEIPGFAAADCLPIRADKTLQGVAWRGGADLPAAKDGQPVRFRFELTDGRLFAFWVCPDEAGASGGYGGAGGPGFTGPTDTVGRANYQAASPAPAEGAAPAPRLWPADGSYTGGVTVRLEVPLCNAVQGAVIRYTSDGSEPTEQSPAYNGPVTLKTAGSITLKARAFAPALAPSTTAEGAFEIHGDTQPPHLFAGTAATNLPGEDRPVVVQLRTGESAVCRYADQAGVPFDQMPGRMSAEGRAVHETVADLPGGTLHTAKLEGSAPPRLFVKARDAYGNTAETDYEIGLTAAPAAPAASVEIRLEAEQAVLAAPMQAGEDLEAIAGRYVSSPERDQGTATFTFSVPADGTYIVWARVLGPLASQDSFFVSVDGAEDVFDVAEGEENLGHWRTTLVNGRGGGPMPMAVNPRLFELAGGEHTLSFRAREPMARLDWVVITNKVESFEGE